MKKLKKHHVRIAVSGGVVGIVFFAVIGAAGFSDAFDTTYHWSMTAGDPPPAAVPVLDKDAYNAKLLFLAHLSAASTTMDASTTTPKGMTLLRPATATTTVSAVKKSWPVATVYPEAGALLPFNRIVAYYGNFYSTKMGVLGEYEPEVMLQKLKSASAEWEAADPETPVIPAIHYIVETAQAAKSKSGKYIARMPDSEIDKALAFAKQADGLVFLDFQVGTSNVERELPMYESYLALPNVHVGIDPEFSMKTGVAPGRVIGTMDAADINNAAQYLATLVREHHLPPKILVVHRFTEEMVTNYQRIKPLPEVQIVMDMDGWGFPAKKINTYNSVVYSEPVQFTGFKLFYKNDVKAPSTRMLTPTEVVNLTPAPSYIQYQ